MVCICIFLPLLGKRFVRYSYCCTRVVVVSDMLEALLDILGLYFADLKKFVNSKIRTSRYFLGKNYKLKEKYDC